jgi:WhiB family redox-sensing transcriptional regulator
MKEKKDQWKERGACKGITEDSIFFPESSDSEWKAKQDKAISICQQCPVRIQCLEYAIQNNEPGVWGGTSERERRRIKRARRQEERIQRQFDLEMEFDAEPSDLDSVRWDDEL